MDDLIRVIQVIQLDAKFFAVLISSCIWMRAISPQALMSLVWVENVVIHGGEGFARLTYRATMGAQTIERLR